MQPIDWNTLLATTLPKVIDLLIGAAGGAIAAWLTYRFGLSHDIKKLEVELRQEFQKRKETRLRDVLEVLWTKTQDMLNKVAIATSPVKSYPDLNNLPEEAVIGFVGSSRLSEFHRQELLKTRDKTRYFSDIIFWYELNDASRALAEVDEFLRHNQIHLPIDLKDDFAALFRLINSAIIGYELWKRSPEPQLMKDSRKELKDADALGLKIEGRIREIMAA